MTQPRPQEQPTGARANTEQLRAEQLREEDYREAMHVQVDLRAEDPAGLELQIWRTQTEPTQKIGNGVLVSLWDHATGNPVQVLRRATHVRSIEKFWVEFILEPYNPFPRFPDPKSHLTIYLAVPIKWAQLHHKTTVIYKLIKAAKQLQNTYTIAPDALPRIRQTMTRYWTTREGDEERRGRARNEEGEVPLE